MKKIRLILFIAVVASVNLLFSSCSKDKDDEEAVTTEETATITFEDVATDSMLYNTSFTSGIMTFKNVYSTYEYNGVTYSSWTGFACSTKTDTVTSGYNNQYSSYAGSGASGSKRFSLAYSDSATCSFGTGVSHKINSVMLTNNTYAALAIKNGYGVATKFSTGSYYKVTITGISTGGTNTGSVDFYLADFRNGKSFICKDWTKVDLSSLGTVNKLIFTFTSTDTGSYGINTPAYVCVDNIVYVK